MQWALKKFFACKINELNTVLQEMRSYVSLKHPCLIQVKDFFVSDIDQEANCCFNLVMEYADGGDLQQYVFSLKFLFF